MTQLRAEPAPGHRPGWRRRAGEIAVSVLTAAAMVGGITAAAVSATASPAPDLTTGNVFGPAPGFATPPSGTVAQFRLVTAGDVFRLEYTIQSPDDAARLVVAATPSDPTVVEVGWRPYVEPATDDDPYAPPPPARPTAVHPFPALVPAGGSLVIRLTVHKPASCPPMQPGSAMGPPLNTEFGWYDGTELRRTWIDLDGVYGPDMAVATCGG